MENIESSHFRGFMWAYLSLGIVALVGGAVSLNFRITDVKRTLFALDTTPGPVQTAAQEQLDKIAEMRLLDSDSDGLSDFNEEYTYNTSAYLADTDSDGVNDSEEITAGEDPNCAAGLTCTTTRTATAIGDVSSGTSSNGASDVSNLSTDDPVALREQLIALGIDKTVLDQVSDEDLITVYSSVAADYSSGSTTAAAAENTDPDANINTAVTNADPYANLLPADTNTNSTPVGSYTFEDLQNLSAADIRTLLVQSGMPSSDVDQLDDATLLQLYQESLAEQQAAQ